MGINTSTLTVDTTEVALLRVIDLTDVAELHNSNITLYPNPSSGNFTLLFAQHDKATSVTISDMAGRRIFATASIQSVMHFDLNLSPGLYVSQVNKTDGDITTKRIVVR